MPRLANFGAAVALGAHLCCVSGDCTGVAGESKNCRRAHESYVPAVLPPPLYSLAGSEAGFDDMQDLELVLKQFGLHGLGVLNVTYPGGVTLHGAATRVDNGKDSFVGVEPEINWECSTDGCKDTMVLMLDPDCGGRRSDHPEEVGWCGPALHSIWIDCKAGALLSCTRQLPYLPPGVSNPSTNRYAFILFRQLAPLNVDSLPARSRAPRGVGYYNLAKLLSSNRLEPVSWNYMYVTGTGPPAWKKALKRGKHRG